MLYVVCCNITYNENTKSIFLLFIVLNDKNKKQKIKNTYQKNNIKPITLLIRPALAQFGRAIDCRGKTQSCCDQLVAGSNPASWKQYTNTNLNLQIYFMYFHKIYFTKYTKYILLSHK